MKKRALCLNMRKIPKKSAKDHQGLRKYFYNKAEEDAAIGQEACQGDKHKNKKNNRDINNWFLK